MLDTFRFWRRRLAFLWADVRLRVSQLFARNPYGRVAIYPLPPPYPDDTKTFCWRVPVYFYGRPMWLAFWPRDFLAAQRLATAMDSGAPVLDEPPAARPSRRNRRNRRNRGPQHECPPF